MRYKIHKCLDLIPETCQSNTSETITEHHLSETAFLKIQTLLHSKVLKGVAKVLKSDSQINILCKKLILDIFLRFGKYINGGGG